mgnify:CR=1 FL=1
MSSTADVEDRLLRVSEQLQIPHNTLQITQVRLGQLRNKPDVDEGNIDDYVAAALALSAREDGLPIREDVIEDAWSETLGPDRRISLSNERLETTRRYLDVETVPPHPIALLEQLGQSIEMPESLIVVARRLLNDAYEVDPTVVAGGRSPTATANPGRISAAVFVTRVDRGARIRVRAGPPYLANCAGLVASNSGSSEQALPAGQSGSQSWIAIETSSSSKGSSSTYRS